MGNGSICILRTSWEWIEGREIDRGYLQFWHIPMRLNNKTFLQPFEIHPGPQKMNTYPLIFFFYLPFVIFVPDSMQKTEPKRARVEEMESIAILIRDDSDINTMKDEFGDVLPDINPIISRDPRDMMVLLQNMPVRSCFIIVEATKIKEESLTKSSSTVYQDLLKTANRIVGKNISSLSSLHTSLLYQEIRSSLPLYEFVTKMVFNHVILIMHLEILLVISRHKP